MPRLAALPDDPMAPLEVIRPRPLVSALMVTAARADRFPWIVESLADYGKQTYAPRELVVVLDDPAPADRQRLEAHLVASGLQSVRLVRPGRKLSLGALRNVSLDAALGDIICLWDDDDLHHPRRMENQVDALLGGGARAVLLSDCLHVFMDDGHCYWVNWAKTRFGGLPGTLVAWRNHGVRYPEAGTFAQAGEDTDFLVRLAGAAPVAFLAAPPLLYLYRYHGCNTWQREHHLMLARRFCEPRTRLLRDRPAIGDLLGQVELGLSPTSLADAEGVVFRVGSERGVSEP
jgi:glycosyltransferase involved in cell wall biosynthesis